MAFHKSPVENKAGLIVGMREEWQIAGSYAAADPVSLAAGLAVMEAAYAVDHQTVKLIGPDGSTVIRFMAGVDPLGGVRVVQGPSQDRDGAHDAEGTTYRHYTIRLESTYGLTGGADVLMEWFEKLTFRGGGPRFVHLQPLVGFPQRQQVAEATPYRVTQRGRAVGLYSWPSPPGPLWPAAVKQDEIEIDYEDPERKGGLTPVFVNWPVSWSYQHEDAGPLAGTPTLWTS